MSSPLSAFADFLAPLTGAIGAAFLVAPFAAGLAAVFAGTALSQTGKAIEIIFIVMMTYLTISLLISFILNLYNKKIAIIER